MSETMKKFLATVSADKDLQAKALACTEMGEEEGKKALIALAKEIGFELTMADFEKPDSEELDDDDLDSVAGGAGGCACPFAGGGGGTSDVTGKTFGCACAVYGQGGDGSENHWNCFCAVTGAGASDVELF